MSCRSSILLICMFMAVSLATLDPDSTKERSVTESVREVKQGAGEELGALLDAGAGAVITVEAGGTRLAAHRAVLAARSPALAAMLRHKSIVAGGRLSVPGVEGPVLRRLLAYLYTLRAPRLPPGAATQLLAAAHRLGLPALQADCERQVAAQLSVETAASVAVLAVKHSLTDLRDAAINFIKDHFVEVLATKGWADAVEKQPREVIKVTLLLAGLLAGTSMEAGNTTSTQPHSGPSQTPPPVAACPTAPLDEATVSRLRSLSGEERDRRLRKAADEGAVGELRALLAAGADVGTKDVEGYTALHMAAFSGHVQAASCLLEGGAQVDANTIFNVTALHRAAFQGHGAMARLLLAAFADPNAKEGFGCTPLHLAAMKGSAEVAAALLEEGADRAATDKSGRTPLNVAMDNDSQHLFEMLTQP